SCRPGAHRDLHSFPTRRSSDLWIDRAAEVAALLAVDAVERDRAGRTPHAEVQLLKDSGLATLLGPREHGGGEQTWSTAYRVIREDRKSTRLNSSHVKISYAVFC